MILKEYCDFDPSTSSSGTSRTDLKFREAEGADFFAPKKDTLMVEVEGIHAYPFHTRNFTRYMPEALRGSQRKWTTPYLKPLIKHHNDQNGEIIGRIYDARYTEETSIKNIGGLLFTISVPDKRAAEDVENRILETVSIGVSANDVRCSICGAHIVDANEGCPEGHIRSHEYEGETCFWDIYDIDPKELSYVIVPSDIYAKNKRIYRAEEENGIVEQKETAQSGLDFKESNTGDNPPNMDFEQQLAAANEKIEALQVELDQAREALKEVDELKAKNEELKQTIETVQAAVSEKDSALEQKDEQIRAFEEDLATVQHEREAAEEAGMQAQESLRSFIEDTVQQYRKLLGKTELKEEELKARSLDSLKDSLKDFKEEMSFSKTIDIIEQKVPNPVAPKEPGPKKTSPSADYKTVDFSEKVQELFANVLK
jgi:DNA repair exonuclease SbcCD ATPase subunit